MHDTPVLVPSDQKPGWRLSQVLYVLVLAAIASSAALTARSLSRLVDAQAAVTESLVNDGTLKDLLNDLLDAETAERGFLLTGRANYLDPYYASLTQLFWTRDKLAVALNAEPSGRARLEALNQAIAAKLHVLTRAVSLKSEGRNEEVMDLVLADADKKTMDAVRVAVRNLANDEARRTAQQRAAHAREIRITYWVGAGSITLNLILLGSLVLYIRRATVQERTSRREMAARNGELSRLVQAAGVHNEQARALSALSRFLQSCATLGEAHEVLQQQLPRLMGADSGALYLFSASRNQLRKTFGWGEESFVESLETADCWALRLGQPHRSTASGGAPGCRHLKDAAHGSSSHCLPLVAHGDLMGLMVLGAGVAVDQAAPSNQEDHRLLTLEQVALSIGNLRLRESLRQQSIRDELTGLYNRRFLEESAQREVQRAARLQAQGGHGGMALLMIDVDHFKRFNDLHGHEMGDRVLREVAQVLKRVSRDSDVAARYGGEEFTVMMTDMTTELSVERAEQLRQEIEALTIEASGMALEGVTISIGVAQFPTHGRTAEALFRAADKALYEAKRAGRNRIALAA